MKISAIHPKDLGATERARWDALRTAEPACASPYFSIAYTKTIGAVRGDARVAVIEDGGAIVGFFPVQRASRFAAMGLGAPITDMQGLVASADLAIDKAGLCRALGVGRIDILVAPAALTALAAELHGRGETFITHLSGQTGAAFDAALRAANPGTVKKQNQKRRKLEREVGPLRLTAPSRDRAALETLLEWKRRQCQTTRQPKVWETPWVAATIERLWAGDDPDLRLIHCTLHAGDTLAAGFLMLQSGRHLHAWIIGYEPALAAVSPGVLLARAAMAWAADHGFQEVDWGGGRYTYKEMITQEVRPTVWGSLHGRSMSGMLRAGLYGVRGLVEQAPLGGLRTFPGKAMRRLDVLRGLGLTPPARPT
jgi:CelD/BcsL family acetyltransferase involved in cellulose biosynthesis